MQNNLQKNDLIPVSKWNDYYDYPTVGALRQLIFYNTNDFVQKVIRKIGKRMYINATNFFAWVENSKEVE